MKAINLKNKVVSGLFWKFGERFVAQTVSFVVSLILARILMPEDYGIVVIINIFIAVADVFLSSGLNTALIQKEKADEIDFSTMFYCNLFLGIVLYFVLFMCAPIIARIYRMPILINAIRIFALRLPISSFQSIQTAYVSKEMDFKKFFFSTLTGTLISAIVGIVMAAKGFGVWSLIAQYMTNTVIDTLFLFFTVKWYPKLLFSWDRAKPLIKFGSKIMATDLIGTIFNQLSSSAIGISYSSSDLAYYNKGKNFPELINNNIYSALSGVLFPAMSIISNNANELKSMIKNSLQLSSYVIYPINLGMFAVANTMIEVLLTSKWSQATIYVQLAALSSVFGLVSTIDLQSIKGLGRSDLTLKLEFIKKPFFLVCLGLALRVSVSAIGAVMLLVSVWEMLTNMIVLKRLINYSLIEQFKDVLPALLLSVTMAIVVLTISYFNIPPIVMLFLQIFVGVLVYVGFSKLFKVKQFDELLSMIKNMGKLNEK